MSLRITGDFISETSGHSFCTTTEFRHIKLMMIDLENVQFVVAVFWCILQ